MRLSDIAKGMRVTAVDQYGPDSESGVVVDINPMSATGHEVLVAFDQCVQVWVEASALMEES